MFKRVGVSIRAMFGDRDARTGLDTLDRLDSIREWAVGLRHAESRFREQAAMLAHGQPPDRRRRVDALLVTYDQTRAWLDNHLHHAATCADREDWATLNAACDAMEALRRHFAQTIDEVDHLLAAPATT